jgi:hypothetical protein
MPYKATSQLKNWPKILSYLHDGFGYQIREDGITLGYSIFRIDLSSWRLRLGKYTPVIWVKDSDLMDMNTVDLIESIHDVIKNREWSYQIIIVLLDGKVDLLPVSLHNPLYSLVLIDSANQKVITESRHPSSELRKLVINQVKLTFLSPYETAAPVVGSRFFGRSSQIRTILSNPDTNFLVLGIRRIGKTSLLREVGQILLEGNTCHPIFLDCSDLKNSNEYIEQVVRILNIKELPRLALQNYTFFFPDFLERMKRKNHKKIVFLLDEIDALIGMPDSVQLFNMLRASSNKGVCQYIMAGFWKAWNAQYSLDHPFFNFFRQIRLTAFERSAAEELITQPMESLQIHFKNREEIVTRLYEETAGHPNLIQFYCLLLIRYLEESNERTLTLDHILKVQNDPEVQDHLLVSFMHNTGPREKAVVYALLLNGAQESLPSNISPSRVDTSLKKLGVKMPIDEIDDACKFLALAGVLHKVGIDYSFNAPVFVRTLRQQYDLRHLFSKLKEAGL